MFLYLSSLILSPPQFTFYLLVSLRLSFRHIVSFFLSPSSSIFAFIILRFILSLFNVLSLYLPLFTLYYSSSFPLNLCPLPSLSFHSPLPFLTFSNFLFPLISFLLFPFLPHDSPFYPHSFIPSSLPVLSFMQVFPLLCSPSFLVPLPKHSGGFIFSRERVASKSKQMRVSGYYIDSCEEGKRRTGRERG